jgi:transposase-like protein
MANNLGTSTKQAIYQCADKNMSNSEISRELGIKRESAARWANPYRDAKNASGSPVVTSTQPDVQSIVAEVLKRMNGNPEAKPDKIEVVAAPTFTIPRSRIVNFSDKRFERVVYVSDMHHPFHDVEAIRVTLAAIKDYRPQCLINAGDYFDCFSISDHDKEPGRCDNIQDEFDAAQPTSRAIDEAIGGNCTALFLDGNHEERINRMQRKNPGLFNLRSLSLPIAADLPKRWMYYPNQTQFRCGALSYLHGDLKGRGNAVKHAAHGMLSKLRTSCIFGHFHRFQHYLETAADGSVRGGWANGHLCDVSQAHYITSPEWHSGFSTIDYDWDLQIFSVTPHLIVRNALRWGSKTYVANP